MAAFDTQTKRMAILSWGVGFLLPVADSSFDGLDAQVFLAQPAQYDIENGEPPVESTALANQNLAGPSSATA